MISLLINRMFFFFKSTRNRLILVRERNIEFSYSTKKTWRCITVKKAFARFKRNKPCVLQIQSKFNGIHILRKLGVLGAKEYYCAKFSKFVNKQHDYYINMCPLFCNELITSN